MAYKLLFLPTARKEWENDLVYKKALKRARR